jgi:FG-GAP-like repeat
MVSVNRCIVSWAKFSVAVVSLLLSISAFAIPPANVLDETHASVRAVMAVQEEVTPSLIAQPEILGTAVGLDDSGNPTLTVYVDQGAANVGEVMRSLPREIRGTRVQVELMDEIRAMGYTARQTPPIRLGTSGGWAYDFANGYCCGGTLGALVRIGTTQYILSACHVLEGDIVAGGNNRIAQTGDSIIQPGLIDENCNRYLAQTVGTLVKRRSLSTSNVDCAIARVVAGMVRTDGAILGIGTISHYISAASLHQQVKKSGGTSGTTHSRVSGLNASVRVTFTRECHGRTYQKTFYGQIVIANSGSNFLDHGDSGSLMVEDVATNPRAVGLLFAGSSTSAFANPINEVLTFLGATMVGAPVAAGPAKAAVAAVADFNGDRHPDYVLQNASTHQKAIWYLNNNVFVGGAYGPTLPVNWGLEGVADFNRDSHPDYALFNPVTYRTAIWYLSGPTFIGGGYGPTLPTGWELVATADFNGDGNSDYVLYKASTRQTAIWYLNKNVFAGGGYGPTLPAGWSLIGIADFNRDGHRDYALFNPTTRQTAIWYLSGVTFIGGAYGPSVPNGWQLVATADFNGDNKPDYLLYNGGTRQTAIWYMNNNVLAGGALGPTLPAGWSLVAP